MTAVLAFLDLVLPLPIAVAYCYLALVVEASMRVIDSKIVIPLLIACFI